MEPRLRLQDLLSQDLFDFCDSNCDDELFLTAFESFENELQTFSSPTQTKPISTRFAAPKTEKDIEKIKLNGIPKKTQVDTEYCMKVWEEWCHYHRHNCGDNIVAVTEMQPIQLQYWLMCYVLEVHKKDGTEYPPNTLNHLCCGIMRFLRWNGSLSIDFFKAAEFADFRCTLDGEMKRLQFQGIGSKK